MMMLSLMIMLCGAGSILSLCWKKQSVLIGVVTSSMVLVCAIALYVFWENTGGMQFVEHHSWFPEMGLSFSLGVDGISLVMIMLTAFMHWLLMLLTPIFVHENKGAYTSMLLLLQAMFLGVFSAMDGILFFFFWEGSLIPLYLCVGRWGSDNRSYAAIKLFLFSFLGSTLLLISILYLYHLSGSMQLSSFSDLTLSHTQQIYLFFGFLAAFAIKIPMVPVHTWLPDAHTEAPTAGSVLLAALMLKVGAFGLLRFSLPIVPWACAYFAYPMMILSLIAVVYIGLIAFAQDDLKRLIAYSSVAHMGFVTLGLFAVFPMLEQGNSQAARWAINGAVVQMVAHAFGSGALFLTFGMLYLRLKTRSIEKMKGVAQSLPILSGFFLIFCLTNVAVPGTAGFVGEFMTLLALGKGGLLGWSVVAGTSVVIAAVYTLWMFRRVFFESSLIKEKGTVMIDIMGREAFVLSCLVAGVFALGCCPSLMTNVVDPSVKQLVNTMIEVKK